MNDEDENLLAVGPSRELLTREGIYIYCTVQYVRGETS
jgi:hypothetical protein